EATALLQQALSDNPNDTDALIASARMSQASGQVEESLAFARRAVASDSDNLAALVVCAELEHGNGFAAQAETLFERARGLAPQNSALAFNVGLTRYAQADFAGAAKAYQQALALDPGNDDARRNGIMALAGSGDMTATIDSCKQYLADRRGTAARGFEQPLPADEAHTTRFKLEHDCQQLRYLLDNGAVSDNHLELVQAYEAAIADLQSTDANQHVIRAEQRGDHWRLLEQTYNRPLHVPTLPQLQGPLINPDLDIESIESRYLDEQPHVTYVDNLLAPDALIALRQFLYSATIWYDIKPNYLGAYFIEGFANRLTLGIAEGLRRALPRVFGDHRLTQSWAYKYGPRLTGIPTHADAAAVNVNFWIAPDEANLDAQTGGLKVYNIAAPREWDFQRFNNDQQAMAALLADHRDDFVRIPHRCNRAVIFDSNLFHETDEIHFVDDYLSRRINVTILYGLRDA
ncbi:MAG: hypothetical protein HKN49_11340, partial [Gammaproteobacteria bacterium]|nr:hypothetical protein [Gammaproteobacteria bacterium]